MSTYLLVDIDLKDPARYEAYKRAVPELIRRHGGEYLVRGGQVEVVEGDWKPGRFVLMRFPDRQALQGYLDDPDYAPLKALRQEVADSNVVAMDGV